MNIRTNSSTFSSLQVSIFVKSNCQPWQFLFFHGDVDGDGPAGVSQTGERVRANDRIEWPRRVLSWRQAPWLYDKGGNGRVEVQADPQEEDKQQNREYPLENAVLRTRMFDKKLKTKHRNLIDTRTMKEDFRGDLPQRLTRTTTEQTSESAPSSTHAVSFLENSQKASFVCVLCF